MEIKKTGSGTPWESQVGYSRGVRIGNTIEIAGTTAVDGEGNAVGKNDPYAQTVFIIRKAREAIQKLGGRLDQVTRTRIFVTDISKWEDVGKAHGEYFREIKPASTMVEVSRLVHPDLLVEVEFTAVVH
jgi:enamine deaminase RidA (YjgF/YER057c/UK114 family)